jgi:hypothetical protein
VDLKKNFLLGFNADKNRNLYRKETEHILPSPICCPTTAKDLRKAPAIASPPQFSGLQLPQLHEPLVVVVKSAQEPVPPAAIFPISGNCRVGMDSFRY